MKYLFVGGSNDGRRIDLYRLQPYIQLYVRPNKPVGILEQPDAQPEFETEVYKATPFRGDNTEFWIYVLDGITPDSLIQRLIDCYLTLSPSGRNNRTFQPKHQRFQRIDHMIENPYLFACDWYKPEQVFSCLNHNLNRPDADRYAKIPADVTSLEFATWLTEEYRLAMAKGIELGKRDAEAAFAEKMRVPDPPVLRECCRKHWADDARVHAKAFGCVLMNPMGMPFITCGTCRNKRCPRATDCDLACSGTNEPGQEGSIY